MILCDNKRLLYITLNLDAYATKDIEFEWQDTNALQVGSNVQMPDFILTSFTNYKCNRTTSTGKSNKLVNVI